MKILKYVFLLLILATVAVVVFIATQEGKYDIKRERIISVPRSTLYNYINDLRNWENVALLTPADSSAVFTYSDSTSGPKAFISWKHDGAESKVETVKNTANDSIIQTGDFNGEDNRIAWGFSEAGKGTKVAVRIKGELTFAEKAAAVFNGNPGTALEEKLEAGLENLNRFLVTEIAKYDVKVQGLVTKTAAYYIGFPVTGKIEDIGRQSSGYYPKLHAFIKENKIVQAGAPFLLYKTFSEAQGTASYVVCMPVKEEIYTMQGSEIIGGRIEGFTALKTTLKGDYSHLKKAWDTARREVTAKSYPENTGGLYLEVYTKGLPSVKRPSQWVTDIYIPIGQNTAPATTEEVPMPPVSGSQPAPAAGTQVKPAKPASTGTATQGTPTDSKPAPKPKPKTATRPPASIPVPANP